MKENQSPTSTRMLIVLSVANSSFGALWGGVFNYPNDAAVSYTLEDVNDIQITN
jgi:hypothetical protein